MKRLIVLIFVINGCLAATSQAQNAYRYLTTWYMGSLVTQNGDTLSGEIQFNWETNSLKIKQRGTLKAYSSSNISTFEFFDPYWRSNRYFISQLVTQKKSDYQIPAFFELLFYGKISILMRENDNESTFLNIKKLIKPSVECYLRFPEGNLKRYDGRRKVLYELLPSHHSELDEFITRKGLNIGNLADLVRILQYYDKLEGSQ